MFIVTPGSRLVGMSLREVDLRRRAGSVAVALVRDTGVIYNPGPEIPLEAGDQLVLMGSRRQLGAAHEALSEIQEQTPFAGPPPVAG